MEYGALVKCSRVRETELKAVKPCPSPTLFTNPAGTGLVSNEGLRGDRPVTNRLGKFR
jgi:hypothetical protein